LWIAVYKKNSANQHGYLDNACCSRKHAKYQCQAANQVGKYNICASQHVNKITKLSSSDPHHANETAHVYKEVNSLVNEKNAEQNANDINPAGMVIIAPLFYAKQQIHTVQF
jgi:hypothetical protein